MCTDQHTYHIVYFKDGGTRRNFHHHTPAEVKSHRTISSTSNVPVLPLEYYQIHYPNFENGCVWLATCQLMFTLNTDLAARMIKKYKKPFKI